MGMFMSLEDFLALPPGSIVLHAPASHWLAAYRTAKASFETYGDAGPPSAPWSNRWSAATVDAKEGVCVLMGSTQTTPSTSC